MNTKPTSTLTAAVVWKVDALYRAAGEMHTRAASHYHIGGERRHRRARLATKGALRLERRAWKTLEDALGRQEQWNLLDMLVAENARNNQPRAKAA